MWNVVVQVVLVFWPVAVVGMWAVKSCGCMCFQLHIFLLNFWHWELSFCQTKQPSLPSVSHKHHLCPGIWHIINVFVLCGLYIACLAELAVGGNASFCQSKSWTIRPRREKHFQSFSQEGNATSGKGLVISSVFTKASISIFIWGRDLKNYLIILSII